jgi:hypothetical protein
MVAHEAALDMYPRAWSAGLPMGLQIIAAPRRDADLLAVAVLYEKLCPWLDRLPALIGGREQEPPSPRDSSRDVEGAGRDSLLSSSLAYRSSTSNDLRADIHDGLEHKRSAEGRIQKRKTHDLQTLLSACNARPVHTKSHVWTAPGWQEFSSRLAIEHEPRGS